MRLASDVILPALLLASAGLNMVQWKQLRATQRKDAPLLGQAAPAITAATLDGRRVSTPMSGDLPAVLYVFSPGCLWCERNHEYIVKLSEQLRGRYRFMGLSLSGTGLAAHLAQKPLPFPVYTNPSVEALLGYRMGETPQTVVVSRDGTVERNWAGAYLEGTGKEIEEFFGVRLTGVTGAVETHQ